MKTAFLSMLVIFLFFLFSVTLINQNLSAEINQTELERLSFYAEESVSLE